MHLMKPLLLDLWLNHSLCLTRHLEILVTFHTSFLSSILPSSLLQGAWVDSGSPKAYGLSACFFDTSPPPAGSRTRSPHSIFLLL